jgi:hypothetical protein
VAGALRADVSAWLCGSIRQQCRKSLPAVDGCQRCHSLARPNFIPLLSAIGLIASHLDRQSVTR